MARVPGQAIVLHGAPGSTERTLRTLTPGKPRRQNADSLASTIACASGRAPRRRSRTTFGDRNEETVIKTLRRLRAAVGNGLVWGAAWFTTAFVAYGGLGLLGAFEGVVNPLGLVLGIALNVGVTGFVTGLGFSAFLRFGFLDRPLLGLRARWMALGGAGVASVTSVLFGVALRASLGDPLMLEEVLAGLPMVALFGAVTAGATIRIAQRAQRRALASATAELEAEQRETLGLLEAESVSPG